MAQEVHVIMSGIVSLIPSANGGATPSSWKVRLHDASASHHPHFPSVVVDQRDVIHQSRDPNKTKPYTDGTRLAGWYLGKGPIHLPTIVSEAIKEPKPLPYALQIATGCLGNGPCSKAKVNSGGAWLDVGKGSLAATQLDHDYKWKFSNSSGTPEWLADEVCWSFLVDDPEFAIDLPDRGNKRLKLTLKAFACRKIEIRLQNMLHRDLFPTKGVKEPKDCHVKLYFEISNHAPTDLPFLEGTAGTDEPPVDDHDHCLGGDVIAAKIPTRGALIATVAAWAARMLDGVLRGLRLRSRRAVRVNCPPGQWTGEI